MTPPIRILPATTGRSLAAWFEQRPRGVAAGVPPGRFADGLPTLPDPDPRNRPYWEATYAEWVLTADTRWEAAYGRWLLTQVPEIA
jgi:hypothetical protein